MINVAESGLLEPSKNKKRLTEPSFHKPLIFNVISMGLEPMTP